MNEIANKQVQERRKHPRIIATLPVKVIYDIIGQTIDISQGGIKFSLPENYLLPEGKIIIDISPDKSIELDFKIIWSKHLIETKNLIAESSFIYGAKFTGLFGKKEEDIYKAISIIKDSFI